DLLLVGRGWRFSGRTSENERIAAFINQVPGELDARLQVDSPVLVEWRHHCHRDRSEVFSTTNCCITCTHRCKDYLSSPGLWLFAAPRVPYRGALSPVSDDSSAAN